MVHPREQRHRERSRDLSRAHAARPPRGRAQRRDAEVEALLRDILAGVEVARERDGRSELDAERELGSARGAAPQLPIHAGLERVETECFLEWNVRRRHRSGGRQRGSAGGERQMDATTVADAVVVYPRAGPVSRIGQRRVGSVAARVLHYAQRDCERLPRRLAAGLCVRGMPCTRRNRRDHQHGSKFPATAVTGERVLLRGSMRLETVLMNSTLVVSLSAPPLLP